MLTTKMLQKRNLPTSIFAASDTKAMRIVQAASELRILVPHDLSVVGFDDLDIADVIGLTITNKSLFSLVIWPRNCCCAPWMAVR